MPDRGAGATGPDLPDWARQLLRCPACRSPLADGVGQVRCTAADCARVYPVDETGIPELVLPDTDPAHG